MISCAHSLAWHARPAARACDLLMSASRLILLHFLQTLSTQRHSGSSTFNFAMSFTTLQTKTTAKNFTVVKPLGLLLLRCNSTIDCIMLHISTVKCETLESLHTLPVAYILHKYVWASDKHFSDRISVPDTPPTGWIMCSLVRSSQFFDLRRCFATCLLLNVWVQLWGHPVIESPTEPMSASVGLWESIYLLQPSQPHRVITSVLFTKSNITEVEYNAKHAQYIYIYIYKRKTYQHNPNVSPFGIALVEKWQIKLGDAGIIDRFGLLFQYQMLHKRMDKDYCKLKLLYKCIKANTSAIWQHMLHIPPTKVLIS